MEGLKVGWSDNDESENFERFQTRFLEASEVVLNETSLFVRNIYRDYDFIGPTADLGKILIVRCIYDDGIRKIRWARVENSNESAAYFSRIAYGE